MTVNNNYSVSLYHFNDVAKKTIRVIDFFLQKRRWLSNKYLIHKFVVKNNNYNDKLHMYY